MRFHGRTRLAFEQSSACTVISLCGSVLVLHSLSFSMSRLRGGSKPRDAVRISRGKASVIVGEPGAVWRMFIGTSGLKAQNPPEEPPYSTGEAGLVRPTLPIRTVTRYGARVGRLRCPILRAGKLDRSIKDER